MIKRLSLVAAALSLSGCMPLLSAMTGGLAAVPAAPAPLARTTIDDTALETAWKSFDVALDAINLLGDQGIIVPGSARGKAVAAGIRKVNSALGAAERFAAAGSSSDYGSALREAAEGLADLRAAVKGQ